MIEIGQLVIWRSCPFPRPHPTAGLVIAVRQHHRKYKVKWLGGGSVSDRTYWMKDDQLSIISKVDYHV